MFFCQSVSADSLEEYKCELMMKGYQFSNDGLSEAIIKNDKEAVELFVKADLNINLPDTEGYNAMDRALKTNNKDTVLLLAQAGAETKKVIIEQKNDNVEKPKNIPREVKPQKPEKNTVETEEEVQLNELCEAVNLNKLDTVAKLVKTSPDTNCLTSEGLAPIHYAIFNDNPAMVHVLLNGGADVNILTSDGLTPLDIAVLNNQKIIARELLESGGALSDNVAKELVKFGCPVKHDEDFDLYDASFDDIFAAMSKIQDKINSQN